jgi:hypothetical protein
MPRFNNAYAFIIGINNYRFINHLHKAVNDALDVKDVLIDENLGGYYPENVCCLTDENATKQAFEQSMNWLAKKANEQSTVTIYFSGHGAYKPQDRTQGYLLLHDSDPWSQQNNLQLDVVRLAETAVSTHQFTDALNHLKARKITVIFDTCYAGGLANPRNPFFNRHLLQRGLPAQSYSALMSGSGRVVIASSRPEQIAWEKRDMRNGIFTFTLLKGLRGEAAREDGVHILDLFFYLEIHVPKILRVAEIIDEQTGMPAQQNPYLKAETENNYLIALSPLPAIEEVTQAHDVRKYQTFLVELLYLLNAHFSKEEIKTLCFELRIDYSNLEAEGKVNKARELIALMERQGRIIELLTIMKRKRPNVSWPKIPSMPENVGISSGQFNAVETAAASFTQNLIIQFSNQNRALWAIEQQLVTDEPYIFITAAAQMGKSYLLQELKRRCDSGELNPNPTNGNDGPSKWYYAFVDIKNANESITTDSDLIIALSQALGGSVGDTIEVLARQIRAHEDNGARVLFLINGTEYITEEVAQFLHILFRDLERRLGDTPKFNPALVAAGRLSYSSWENSYAPKMKSVELESFSPVSIEEILKRVRNRSGVRELWYKEQARKIYDCSGGHPGCIVALIQHLHHARWTITDSDNDRIFQDVIVPIIESEILSPQNLCGHIASTDIDNQQYQQLTRVFLELSTFRIITLELIEIVVKQLGLGIPLEGLLKLEEQIGNTSLVKWEKRQGWSVIPRSVRLLLSRWLIIMYADEFRRNHMAANIYHQWLDRSQEQPARPLAQGEAQISYICEALYHFTRFLKLEKDAEPEDLFGRLEYRLKEYSRFLQVDPGQNAGRMLTERLHEDSELHELIDGFWGDSSYYRLINSISDIS